MSVRPEGQREIELGGRLPWLLVFRAGVATALLALTLFAEWRSLALAHLSPVLYVVVIGNYLAVIAMALLLRARAAATVLAGAYLALAIVSAFAVVQVTGVVDSAFTFLYLLAILDAAIVGGRRVALAAAAASTLAYGTQLVMQVYGVAPAGKVVRLPDWEPAGSGLVNLGAFYLTAVLAGFLAELWRRARQEATRAAADLEEAERLHATILEALPVGVLAVDPDLRVLAANAAADAIVAGGPRLVGQRLPAPLADALPRPDETGVAALTLGGVERVLSLVRSRPVKVDDGDRAPLDILVVEDRTALTRLESQLAARERLATIGELAAAIAHEIRNPLAAISGSLELLLSGDADASAAGPLTDIVLREVSRLDRLVDEFLQFARPAPIERARVDLVGLARDVCAVALADGRFGSHPLSISAPDALEAEVDAERVRQVLWNLLRNALEASPDGAPVEIRIARPAGGSGVLLEIRDHGPGIEPGMRAHLFEPFRTSKPNGTGLGLAVVSRIVEGHGGAVELGDAAGGGTLARVSLPA